MHNVWLFKCTMYRQKRTTNTVLATPFKLHDQGPFCLLIWTWEYKQCLDNHLHKLRTMSMRASVQNFRAYTVFWLTFCLLVSSADNLWNSLDPDQAWHSVQTVWHSDGILEWIFRKSWFWKKSADDKKACKITQHAKSLKRPKDST